MSDVVVRTVGPIPAAGVAVSVGIPAAIGWLIGGRRLGALVGLGMSLRILAKQGQPPGA